MEIKLVSIEKGNMHSSDNKSEIVVLKVSGEGDYSNSLVQRARELIMRNGSDAMLESFDWALENKTFSVDK